MLTARVFVTMLLLASSVGAASIPIDVSIQHLVATPQQFNGKQVSVTGYLDVTETHTCDLRATKKRPNDNRPLINIEIPRGSESALKRLTRNFTKLVRAHIVGTFQYVTTQTDYGWEGLWDKQITNISGFHVFVPKH